MAEKTSDNSDFMRISRAAAAAGVSRQTLQYYLMIGLLESADRSPSGHQLFDQTNIERIKMIKKLNESGYPLREIREIFLRDKK